jgi:DNA-binding transcriptional LysR family regulator
VDPHLLRTFLAVARTGSFSQAARDLGYTQSAVSQHIAALESDLGAVLLHRRPVAPTSVGARLLEHAGPLLLRLDAARADIARLTAAPAPRLAIGAAPLAMMTSLFAEALAAFRLRRPSVAVTVGILGRDAVVAAVTTGALDMGLVDGIAAPNDPLHLSDIGSLATVAVAQRPLAVALPPAHPLAGRPGLRLPDLADARWIDAPDTAVPLDQLRRASGSDGYRPVLRYEGADVLGLIALAAAGHGLALLPSDAIGQAPGIAAVPLRAPRLVHRTELLHHAGDEPAALLAAALTAAAQTAASPPP